MSDNFSLLMDISKWQFGYVSKLVTICTVRKLRLNVIWTCVLTTTLQALFLHDVLLYCVIIVSRPILLLVIFLHNLLLYYVVSVGFLLLVLFLHDVFLYCVGNVNTLTLCLPVLSRP